MTGNQAPTPIPLRLLGQSGCRLSFPGCTVYVDPYLSHSVQALDAPDLVRLVPIPLTPAEVTDADWVLITHDHIRHRRARVFSDLHRSCGRWWAGESPRIVCNQWPRPGSTWRPG